MGLVFVATVYMQVSQGRFCEHPEFVGNQATRLEVGFLYAQPCQTNINIISGDISSMNVLSTPFSHHTPAGLLTYIQGYEALQMLAGVLQH